MPKRTTHAWGRWVSKRAEGLAAGDAPRRRGRSATAIQLAALLFGVGCGDDVAPSNDSGPDAPMVAMDGAVDAPVTAMDGAVPPDPPTLGASCESLPDFGDAPGGPRIGQVILDNDADIPRPCEVAVGSFAIARAFDVTAIERLVVVDGAGRRVPAQLMPLSRWDASPDDEGAPLQWVQVAAQVSIDAESTLTFDVVHADAPPQAVEGVTLEGDIVDTGVARFTLARDGNLLARGEAGETTLFTSAGPRLRFGGNTFTGEAVVADEPLEIVEEGPLRVVVRQNGHFVGPGTRCVVDDLDYESMGYTAVASFSRGQSHVDVEFYFRNECGDAWSQPFVEGARTIEEVGFALETELREEVVFASDALGRSAGSRARVAQEKGRGEPWRRAATVSAEGEERESAEALLAPLVGTSGGGLTAVVQMPFMSFREPQALVADGGSLRALVVGDTLRLGEAKGLWGLMRFSFVTEDLESERRRSRLALERGLLVRTRTADLDATELFSPLGGEARSLTAREYRSILDGLFLSTRDEQWASFKIYGSQLWPDIPYEDPGDAFPDARPATPAEMDARMNYWNPSGLMLMEFLRSGEPAHAWDFGLPQSWLQMHSAYYNIGDHAHGLRNGLCVASGGSGEGDWHRSAQGSDDYGYNTGQQHAYLIRPNVGMRDRFRQAGRTVTDRYNVPHESEGERDVWLSARTVSRGTVQHYEMLANCAQFVPGDTGDECRDRLHELMAELYEDNLRGGMVCGADIVTGTRCTTPQQFMINGLIAAFFIRYARTWPERLPGLRDALVRWGRNYERFGLLRDGVIAVTGGDVVAAGLDCTLSETRDDVERCVPSPDSDGNDYVYAPSRAHTLAFVAQLRELGGADVCGDLRAAFGEASLYENMRSWAVPGAGFSKPSSQMMQGMVHAAALMDRCEP